MTLLWLIVCASLIVALMAWSQARRTAKRLTQLTEMHWELRYQHGELRTRVQGGSRDAQAPPGAEGAAPQGESFIPVSSLKR